MTNATFRKIIAVLTLLPFATLAAEESDPAERTSDLTGILAPDATVEKLAGDFKFVEGPAWDFKNDALYFSDIPPGHIVRYKDGKATVANENSGNSNGLMFDKDGNLIACEHGRRRVSRRTSVGETGAAIVA